MKRSRSVLLTLAGTVLVLALTLWPSGGEGGSPLGFWCLFCGTRDAADSVLNTFLFFPVGMGLAGLAKAFNLRRPTALAVILVLALSGLVELAQTTLPGRHPALQDLIFNSLGGLLGAVAFAQLRQGARILLKPPALVRAGSILFPLLVFAFSSLLSRPQVPDRALYGQWAHELGRMIPYPGRILSATAGEVPVPDALVSAQEALFNSLTAGDPIRVTAVAGPNPQTLAHFFAIYDDHQEEVLLLAVQGPDLLFQARTFSVGILFDRPFMRWNGPFDFDEGDTVRVEVIRNPGLRAGGSPCLVVGEHRNCRLAAGVEGGWRLLHRLWGAPSGAVAILGVLWLFLLSFPAGFLATAGAGTSVFRVVALGLGIGAFGVLVSWLTPWLGFHFVQLWAPFVGVAAGRASRVLARRAA